LKVKIHEKDDEDKELIGHYFFPQKPDCDLKHTMTLSEQIQKGFRSYKLNIAIKDSSFGLFEKNRYKTDIGFTGFTQTNEIVKNIKFEKVKFDVTVRIK